MASETGFGIDSKQKVFTDRHPVMNHTGSAARPKCGCGSWRNHWLMYSGSSRFRCVYMGCSSEGEDGGHVRFVKKVGGIWKPQGGSWIVPLCAKHNRSRFDAPFFIEKSVDLIDDSARDFCQTAVYRLNKQNYFHMQVLPGTGAPKCGCASHLAHYRNVTGSALRRCVAMECGAAAVVAAPMHSLDGRTDREKWIAPLCRAHARAGTEIFIKRKAEVASPKPGPECRR